MKKIVVLFTAVAALSPTVRADVLTLKDALFLSQRDNPEIIAYSKTSLDGSDMVPLPWD